MQQELYSKVNKELVTPEKSCGQQGFTQMPLNKDLYNTKLI